ncbi:MAG: site-2 protease family protein [Deltaproteobacteria bacterium]|nr:site-2 protease family protein [Deltaproteobacteria bacterium]
MRTPWSWRIGSIAGIPIRVHVTLLLLLGWFAASFWMSGIGPRATAAGLIILVAVFVIIVAHELSHALMARRFGVATRDILLLPIGGIASLERIPERPGQELAIALVGPVVNLVLAAILYAIVAGAGLPTDPANARGVGEAVLSQLIWINVVLAVFNLLPAFPMDGGRVLRSVLAMWTSRERATEIATAAGKIIAVGLGAIGVFTNLWLVVIAFVVWMGASRERDMVRIRSSLAGVPASEVMSRRAVVVDASETAGVAASRMVDSGIGVLPVVEHGRLVGAVTREDIAAALRTAGPALEVGEAPRHEVVRVAPGTTLDRILDELSTSPEAIAVVVDGEQAVGLVTPEQLMAYVALHPAPDRTATV